MQQYIEKRANKVTSWFEAMNKMSGSQSEAVEDQTKTPLPPRTRDCEWCLRISKVTATTLACRDCDKPMCINHLHDQCMPDCDMDHTHSGVCAGCFLNNQQDNFFQLKGNDWSNQITDYIEHSIYSEDNL